MICRYMEVGVKKIEINHAPADEHAARNILRAGLALHTATAA
jgi:hypothetical protein